MLFLPQDSHGRREAPNGPLQMKMIATWNFSKKERNIAKAKIALLENELSEFKKFNTVLVSRLNDLESKISNDQFEQYFLATQMS